MITMKLEKHLETFTKNVREDAAYWLFASVRGKEFNELNYIDLDDGVKVNCAKFEGFVVKI